MKKWELRSVLMHFWLLKLHERSWSKPGEANNHASIFGVPRRRVCCRQPEAVVRGTGTVVWHRSDEKGLCRLWHPESTDRTTRDVRFGPGFRGSGEDIRALPGRPRKYRPSDPLHAESGSFHACHCLSAPAPAWFKQAMRGL